jgi:hypothetical protein
MRDTKVQAAAYLKVQSPVFARDDWESPKEKSDARFYIRNKYLPLQLLKLVTQLKDSDSSSQKI